MIMTNSLNNLFQRLLENESIFKDKDVLRHSYTPDVLVHRDEQTEELATILVSALRGETPSNILIYGKTGTGKTAVTRYVGKELENMGEKMGVKCCVIYVNCEVVDTQYRLLANLARHFGEEIPTTGLPTDYVFNKFKEALDGQEQVLIVILDEIDKLVKKGDDVLYNLSRINSGLKQARVSIIGVSNDLKFTDFLDPRVKSSLGEEEIIYPPYDADQIRDILYQRAEIAYNENVLDGSVIPMCAALAAQEHGDARRALDLLRVSGEIAERREDKLVTELHVRIAQDKIEVDRVVEVIRTLPTQSKLVLFSIVTLNTNVLSQNLSSQSITTGEVYNIYRKFCKVVDMDILTNRRVTDLISELDMLGIINAIVVSKGRYGRTKEISLSVSVKNIHDVLLDDYKLRPLQNYNHSSKIGYF
ncbi:MAG: ORC1-type DNA replication protein [Methanosarcinales archaeon]|jgi:cell division control protein 6|nr:ORC1-type DNA replication protein [Methanosarcinales archaeon]